MLIAVLKKSNPVLNKVKIIFGKIAFSQMIASLKECLFVIWLEFQLSICFRLHS